MPHTLPKTARRSAVPTRTVASHPQKCIWSLAPLPLKPSNPSSPFRVFPATVRKQPTLWKEGKKIERIKKVSKSKMHKIPSPSLFTDEDKAPGLTIEDSGLTISLPARWGTASQCARANTFIPVDHDRTYYYEMTVVDEGDGKRIGLGFCAKDASLNGMPGWEVDAWGYHADDGAKFPGRSQGLKYGPMYGTGDVVGCGIDFKRGFAFYTLNAEYLGLPDSRPGTELIRSPGPAFSLKEGLRIWPMIGMGSAGAKVSVNFGQRKFAWDGIDDLDGHLGDNAAVEYGKEVCCENCGLH
ncbi:unnamed protein product [Tuber aestivum]|uniref:B30.2/SPRY domain-containing protein n=1 Tax=Tuber aestivum TaxID=59557 RepID=A0A292Q9U1_9PEZI|nr:unnamed protein product [Tuber aestivum]